MIDFQDRVAVITGAGGGLGREYALLLASRGASVVVNDLGGSVAGEGADASPADSVVEEIRSNGGTAVAEYSSVANPEGGAAIIAHAEEEFGRVDILISNAGILRDRTLAKMEVDDLRAVLSVHLEGAFYVTMPAFRLMKAQQYGRIIFASSGSGVFGNFGQTNYAAAKAGLVGFMNALKLEGANYDVLVNAVAPIAHTRMTEEILGDMADRFDADSVAPAVAYLASEANRYSGELWSVGGGSVSRVFTALCEGYFKHPDRDGPLTIEDVAEHVDDVRIEDGYIVPVSSRDEFAKLGPMFYS
ncbi:MAG: SDR family NAD(P)-dependent oxidoreductase [Acidimicrobiia bacterium]|jgi:NAD(P)-dependent dehydrogenase (short-subunit alcohol dehydrogenase family)